VDVPSICVWRDEPSGADVVLLYETGYGSQKDVFVLPNGVAITAAWPGDNTGPGSLHAVQVPGQCLLLPTRSFYYY
jgi:hypothetical protein